LITGKLMWVAFIAGYCLIGPRRNDIQHVTRMFQGCPASFQPQLYSVSLAPYPTTNVEKPFSAAPRQPPAARAPKVYFKAEKSNNLSEPQKLAPGMSLLFNDHCSRSASTYRFGLKSIHSKYNGEPASYSPASLSHGPFESYGSLESDGHPYA
jgi:hypothetical protein